MILFYKILNRLKVLKYFNTTTSISTHNKTLKIPLIRGLGVENLNHNTSWLEHFLLNTNENHQRTIILDVGVNIGQTLLSVKSVSPNCEYFGFEPNPSCVYYVNNLIRVNKFISATVLPIAISDKLELVDLYLNNEADSFATTLEAFRPDFYTDGFKERIISFDLDTLITNYLKITHIDILKIDIEGAELFALKGAKQVLTNYQPLIICEVLDTHSNKTMKPYKNTLKELEGFLDSIDYKIYQIHRNEDDTKVKECIRINTFEPKIWTLESVQLNDYLFIHHQKIELLRNKLKLIN